MGRLFWKFFFFIWLAQLTAIFGLSGAFWLQERNYKLQQEVIDTHPSSVMHVELATKTLQYEGLNALKGLLQKPGPFRLLVLNAQGQDLLGRPVEPSTRAFAEQILNSDSNLSFVRQIWDAAGQRYVFFVVREPHSPLAMRPPPPNAPKILHFDSIPMPVPVMPLLTALIASLIFAVLLAWYFAKPIRTLRSAFDALAQGNLAVRIAAGMGRRRDELADLGHDFDLMANRLQVLMDGQRRLLHDVSHEMRSPLARLQVAIGLARQRPETFDTAMARIERESERMDKLVGELLTLSRLDAGVENSRPDEISMRQLVEDVVEDANYEAEAQGRTVALGQHDDAIVLCQPELLHRALENVVRNAIRYSPPGACVTVEARINHQEKTLTLAVLDQGCGVAESELEAIFEPFNRGGKNAGADGHGLGLAIAQRVLKAHGGSIRAFNRREGGLCVEMQLPLANRS